MGGQVTATWFGLASMVVLAVAVLVAAAVRRGDRHSPVPERIENVGLCLAVLLMAFAVVVAVR